MINIITGGVNTGKSTRLVESYKKLGHGDGFFNRKIYNKNLYIGQEIVRLSTFQTMIWSIKIEGKYSFSSTALKFAEEIVNSVLVSKEPIFIDEIGPLELNENGLDNLFKRCLLSKNEIYVVIRQECVEAVLDKYRINAKQCRKLRTI